MLPTRIPRAWPRPVRELEVITPDGRVFQFPRPSLLRRLFMLLQRHVDTVAISTAILVMIYAAGLAAQALDGSAFDACDLPRPAGSS
jgi:hypothetical protein